MTHWFDVVRLLIFVTFGLGVGLMGLTNFVAFRVLRPPQALGFLWWHVTAISVAFVCFGVVSVHRAVTLLGNPPQWQSWVTLVGCLFFLTAQVIIFRVERGRLIEKEARERLGS